jgi:predicted dehydrogenase
MGDIGTHAHNLARYITGLEVEEICAELSTFIPGRPLDDDGNCLLRFTGGAKGILFASQVSSGEENNLNIRVYGTKGFAQVAPGGPQRARV